MSSGQQKPVTGTDEHVSGMARIGFEPSDHDVEDQELTRSHRVIPRTESSLFDLPPTEGNRFLGKKSLPPIRSVFRLEIVMRMNEAKDKV